MLLDTATNMPEVMAFYQALGCRETGHETRPDWTWTLVYYTKQLIPSVSRSTRRPDAQLRD